jgi:hypothetical protein
MLFIVSIRMLKNSASLPSASVLFIWSIWSVSFDWLNETNQINQKNQIDQMNRASLAYQNSFSAT